MAATLFDSALWRDLYGDAEIQPLFTDTAEIRAMLLAEGALAKVQGRLGLIPEDAAEIIARAAQTVIIDPAALAKGAAAAGVPVPALVTAFRKAMEAPEAAGWAHFGATSQDIADTGLIIRMRRALEIIDQRLEALTAALDEKAKAEAETLMAARTRSQIATPTTFGARIRAWRAPLARSRQRIAELRPRLLRLSLAGASGNLAAMGPEGGRVAQEMAKELRLGHEPVPWHSTRDNIAELGALLAIITGATGKIGLDLSLMMRSEAPEVQAGAPGGSSTMPHKANPVGPEALIMLARANAGLAGRLFEAQLHAEEREGAAWALEWLTLPQMVIAAGASLLRAADLISSLSARPEIMRRSMDATGGLMMAEAASFALAAHMPRPEADALVKAACNRALAEGRSLADVLAEECGAPVNWKEALDPASYTGAAEAIARFG